MLGRGRSDPTPERSLRAAQVAVFVLAAGVVSMAAGVIWIDPTMRHDAFSVLVIPAAIGGLVSPVVAFRLYHKLRRRPARDSAESSRAAVLLRATFVALAVSDAVAVFGTVVFLITGGWAALAGVATHVLLTGAIWPSRARLEVFLTDGDPWDRDSERSE